jgi:hypothetical protein
MQKFGQFIAVLMAAFALSGCAGTIGPMKPPEWRERPPSIEMLSERMPEDVIQCLARSWQDTRNPYTLSRIEDGGSLYVGDTFLIDVTARSPSGSKVQLWAPKIRSLKVVTAMTKACT